MPAPKSQTKVSFKKGKSEVIYESNLDATQYYLHELNRAALRDVGKYVTKMFKNAYYQHFKKHDGDAGKATKYNVWASKSTTAPRVQIGLANMHGFYGYFQEFGTSDGRVPRLGLLTKTVSDNVAEIIKIESTYLSGLSDEASRLNAIVNENEYSGDSDD